VTVPPGRLTSPTGDPDLAELFIRYGTDKDKNGYSPLYHLLFGRMRRDPLVLLEIGIGTMLLDAHSSMQGYGLSGYAPGGSLRAWRDYFSKAQIVGIDVQPDTQFTDERIETYLCDSTDAKAVIGFMKRLQRLPDIVIDDGSHVASHQLSSLLNFFPYLKEGGIYVIEDIQPGSDLAFDPSLVAKAAQGYPFFYTGKQNAVCVIYKKPLKTQREAF